jgi:diaminopropionate ammonia-lyase
LASDFVTIPDQLAVDAMTYLAHSEDMPIVSGESAAGGLGMLLATEVDAELRTALGLDVGSSIVLFGGEGATDSRRIRGTHRRLVGQRLRPATAKGPRAPRELPSNRPEKAAGAARPGQQGGHAPPAGACAGP